MSIARVDFFSSENHVVTQRGDAAVLEYDWDMIRTAAEVEHRDRGREVLV